MHTYVQYVYVFVYIVHTYDARVGEREQSMLLVLVFLRSSSHCKLFTIFP